MILALQLIAGRPSVWLPETLNNRSVDRASFARIVHYSLPWIARIERLARPSFWPGATASVDRLIGLACLVMALLLFLPIPFANGIPALAIISLGLALSERDGIWLVAGFMASALALVVVAAIIGGGTFAVARIF
tara:strand:+ start:218 stop:622 length:405 start_codon:yes stop_codon:yes gene_type:complete